MKLDLKSNFLKGNCLDKENGKEVCSKTSDGSILKITGLPYGYYYVTSTLKDGGMIMVTSVAKRRADRGQKQ